MELNIKETSDGIKWMFGAGTFAILLTLFLVYVDYVLRHSNSEHVLGETLRELRAAQSSLGTGSVDERQLHLGADSHEEGDRSGETDAEPHLPGVAH